MVKIFLEKLCSNKYYYHVRLLELSLSVLGCFTQQLGSRYNWWESDSLKGFMAAVATECCATSWAPAGRCPAVPAGHRVQGHPTDGGAQLSPQVRGWPEE